MKLHKRSRSSHRRIQITQFVWQTKKPANVLYMPFDGCSNFFHPTVFRIVHNATDFERINEHAEEWQLYARIGIASKTIKDFHDIRIEYTE